MARQFSAMLHLPDPLHPFAVHFPVVFLLLGMVCLALSLLWPHEWVLRFAVFAAVAGALGATWAHGTGLQCARAVRYVAAPVVGAVAEHRWSSDILMYASWALGAAAIAAFVLRRIPLFSLVARLVATGLSLFVLWALQASLYTGSELTHTHFFGPNAPKPAPGTQEVLRLRVD